MTRDFREFLSHYVRTIIAFRNFRVSSAPQKGVTNVAPFLCDGFESHSLAGFLEQSFLRLCNAEAVLAIEGCEEVVILEHEVRCPVRILLAFFSRHSGLFLREPHLFVMPYPYVYSLSA